MTKFIVGSGYCDASHVSDHMKFRIVEGDDKDALRYALQRCMPYEYRFYCMYVESKEFKNDLEKEPRLQILREVCQKEFEEFNYDQYKKYSENDRSIVEKYALEYLVNLFTIKSFNKIQLENFLDPMHIMKNPSQEFINWITYYFP
jgi:hypothetical protein